MCRSFSLLKAIAIRLPLLFANAFKSVKERQLLQSDNYMGSNTEMKPWTNLQNLYKNWSKEIKSDNFCYRKVWRAITKCKAKEKSLIKLPILKGTKNYFAFWWYRNNNFADCTLYLLQKRRCYSIFTTKGGVDGTLYLQLKMGVDITLYLQSAKILLLTPKYEIIMVLFNH